MLPSVTRTSYNKQHMLSALSARFGALGMGSQRMSPHLSSPAHVEQIRTITFLKGMFGSKDADQKEAAPPPVAKVMIQVLSSMPSAPTMQELAAEAKAQEPEYFKSNRCVLMLHPRVWFNHS
jgi:hypothetical protein